MTLTLPHPRLLLSVFTFAVLSSCQHVGKQRGGTAPEHSDAMAAAKLSQLAENYWDHQMRLRPVEATFLGDRRFDAMLPDLTPQGQAQALERAEFLRKETAGIRHGSLDAQDRITRQMLLTLLEGERAVAVCQDHMWYVNALDGVQTLLGTLPLLHGTSERAHVDSLIARYRKSGALIDQQISNLRAGMPLGYRAAKVAVERVISQLDAMLQAENPTAAWSDAVKLPDDWSKRRRADTHQELADEATAHVLPALERYRLFLKNEYLPEARAEVGVQHNRDGAKCYRAKLSLATGLEVKPEDLHQTGQVEVAKNVAEMRVLAERLTGKKDLPLSEVAGRLLAQPGHTASSRDEMIAFATALVDKAKAKAPEVFGHLPVQDVEVRPIEPFREDSAPGGYYYPGSRAQGRPGYYYLNTSKPTERLLPLLEPLTFHEAVPGHHTQIALAQALQGLPRFRQELGHPAFVEGWAHYAELLADELGLYSGDAGRFAMLSDQSLRAARLVVDTGLHHLGWSRERAVDFLLQHTAEPRDQVEREVDRYIVWPGQAVSYKVGQLEIRSLRDEARGKLGEAFDLKAFHDRVLKNGAVPLRLLREDVTTWAQGQSQTGASSSPSPAPASAAE